MNSNDERNSAYPLGFFLEEKPTWYAAPLEIVEDESLGKILVEKKGGESALLDELPVEFAFREFLELDARDENALVAFMGEWGLLLHPARYSPSAYAFYKDEGAIKERFDDELALAEGRGKKWLLESMLESLPSELAKSIIDPALIEKAEAEAEAGAVNERLLDKANATYQTNLELCAAFKGSDRARLCNALALSLAEATRAAHDLQQALYSIIRLDSGHTFYGYQAGSDTFDLSEWDAFDRKEWSILDSLRTVNQGRFSPELLFRTEAGCRNAVGQASAHLDFIAGDTPAFSLVNAICNQVIEVMNPSYPEDKNEPYQWRMCKNKKCGRLFKAIRHDKRKPKTKKLPNAQPLYCCDTCTDRGRRRDQYEREKAAKQAGEKRRA